MKAVSNWVVDRKFHYCVISTGEIWISLYTANEWNHPSFPLEPLIYSQTYNVFFIHVFYHYFYFYHYGGDILRYLELETALPSVNSVSVVYCATVVQRFPRLCLIYDMKGFALCVYYQTGKVLQCWTHLCTQFLKITCSNTADNPDILQTDDIHLFKVNIGSSFALVTNMLLAIA